MRGAASVRVAVAVAALGAAVARPSGADEPDAAAAAVAARYRALRLEEALGEFEAAAESWAVAAASPDPEARAEARLRRAAILARLGRADEAREALRALLDDPAPPSSARAEAARRLLDGLARAATAGSRVETPEEIAERERRLALEEEVRGLRRRLDEALRTTADVAHLREALRIRDAALAAMRARRHREERARREAEGAVDPAEDTAARERERGEAAYLSAEYLRLARDAHAAGRFEEARRHLREAVELDPANEGAKDLLRRTAPPHGGTEGVARGILDLLALEHALVVGRVRAEVEGIARSGDDASAAGDHATAATRFEAALARLDARPEVLDDLESLRSEVVARFEASARAAGRAVAAPPRPRSPEGDTRLPAALRGLLESAGSEAAGDGAAMRVFPLAPVVAAQGAALPPTPDRVPRGFLVLPDVPPAGGALRAAVRGAVEPGAWRAPGALLECVGGSLVARAGERALAALESAIAELARPAVRSVPVAVAVVPCDPAALADALRAASARPAAVDGAGGGAMAVDVDGVGAVLALAGAGGPSAAAWVRVPERRGLALVAAPAAGEAPGAAGETVRVEVLAWWLGPGRLAAGVAVEAAVDTLPDASRAFGARVLSRVAAAGGGTLRPGGAFVFPGVPVPGDRAAPGPRHAAVVVTVGDAAHPVPAPSGAEGWSTPLPLGELPRRGLDGVGPLSPVGVDAVAARVEALRGWIQSRAPGGVRVRLAGTGIAVEGGEAVARAVREDIDRLSADAAPVTIHVRVHTLGPAAEAALLRDVPLLSPTGDSRVRFAVLRGRARDRVRFLLAGDREGAPPGAPGSAPALPAQRVVFARVEEVSAADRPVRRGVEVGVRAWPGDLPGERWLWVDAATLDAGDADPRREPAVQTAVPADASLLVAGLPSPLGDPARTRLAVLVEWAADAR